MYVFDNTIQCSLCDIRILGPIKYYIMYICRYSFFSLIHGTNTNCRVNENILHNFLRVKTVLFLSFTRY